MVSAAEEEAEAVEAGVDRAHTPKDSDRAAKVVLVLLKFHALCPLRAWKKALKPFGR